MTTSSAGSRETNWQPKVVYAMAIVCLMLGITVGYLVRGSASHTTADLSSAPPGLSPTPQPGSGQMPTLAQMKEMTDKKAEPLLQQLKQDSKNEDLLLRLAYFYESAHQFKEASAYLDRVVSLDPANVNLRTERASCLYYDGDVEGALAELQQALRINPKDANSLFNLGMIRLQGKQDPAGAIAAWLKLLQTNPGLDKKPIVEQMIAEARQQKSSR